MRHILLVISGPYTKLQNRTKPTPRNHNRSNALERTVIDFWGGGGA